MRRVFLIAILLLPAPAAADAVSVYGLGSRAMGMAGAFSALADDYSAVWYNPAGLAQIDTLDMGLGMTFLSGSFSGLGDVVIGESDEIAGEPSYGSLRPGISDDGGLQGGLAVGLAERVALGIAFHLPSTRFLAKLRSRPQSEPRYLMYDYRPERFSLLMGVGVRVYAGLHLGVGANVMFGPRGIVQMSPMDPNGGHAEIDLTFRPRVAAQAGLLWQITDSVHLALVFRDEMPHGELDLDMSARLPFAAIAARMHSVIFFGPRQFTMGWAWRPHPEVALDLDLTWLQWSRFRDASLSVDAEIEGGNPLPFVPVEDPGFHDSLRLGIGGEWTALRWSRPSWIESLLVVVRAGYSYANSPAPTQTGAMNLLDSDVHLAAVGLGIEFVDLLGFGRSYSLDAHLQVHALPSRRHDKSAEFLDLDGDGSAESRVIGYPGFTAGGVITHGGFTLGMRF